MMTGDCKNVAIFTANEHDRIMILTCTGILTAQDYFWHIKIPCLGKSHLWIRTPRASSCSEKLYTTSIVDIDLVTATFWENKSWATTVHWKYVSLRNKYVHKLSSLYLVLKYSLQILWKRLEFSWILPSLKLSFKQR